MKDIKCPYCNYGGEDLNIGRKSPTIDLCGIPRIICSKCKREFVIDMSLTVEEYTKILKDATSK